MSSSPENETPAVDAQKSTVSAGPILVALGLGGVVGFAVISHDWIAAGSAFLVLCATYFGYRKGAAKILTGVIGILIAIRYSAPLAEKMMAPCSAWLVNVPASLQQPVILMAAGCLIAILVYSVLRIATSLVFRSKPHWKAVDRWLGAALGLVQGIVITLLLLFSLVFLEPIAQKQLQATQSDGLTRLMSTNIVDWSAQLRHSSMGALMEAMDPIRVDLDNRVRDLSKTISLGPSKK